MLNYFSWAHNNLSMAPHNLYYIYTRANYYGFMSQVTKNRNNGLRLH